MPAIISSIPHCTGDPSQQRKTREKCHMAWKGRNIFFCFYFSDDKITHMENPKECTNKLLKIRFYMMVIKYKIKI